MEAMADINYQSKPLPGGTVTFLFTDIEGSTKLLQKLGDDYAIVLAKQREMLRLAFEREADLIIMGVHGRGPLDIAVFGSTAHKVVREAPCPVMTVRVRK